MPTFILNFIDARQLIGSHGNAQRFWRSNPVFFSVYDLNQSGTVGEKGWSKTGYSKILPFFKTGTDRLSAVVGHHQCLVTVTRCSLLATMIGISERSKRERDERLHPAIAYGGLCSAAGHSL